MLSDNRKRQGLLLVVSGPSGVGKGTILRRLFEQRSDCVRSVSATTRSARSGEVPGEQYHFLSLQQFSAWIEEDRFLEWNQHFSAYYGTPKEFVEQARRAGKHVILEIDVKGGLDVMHGAEDCITVFLAPPTFETLDQRLRGRGTESPEQVADRLLVARTELKHMDRYSYTIVNEVVDDAVAQLCSIIDAEMAKTSRVFADGLLPFVG